MEFYFDIAFIQDFQNRSSNSEIIFHFNKFIKQLNGKVFVFNSESQISVELYNDLIFFQYFSTSIPKVLLTTEFE